jgi:glutamate synthase domain-containing protein 3
LRIDAKGLHYRDLNEKIHQAVNSGDKEFTLDNVNGQRYIGDGLTGDNIKIVVNGTAGNDLAAFMDGPTIIVNPSAQDGIGNTMNAGKVIIHGNAGDIVGHSMRGGRIYVRGDAGYRVGIHMKAYEHLYPVVIIGGTAGDFLGEYMAGGLIVVLGLDSGKDAPVAGNYAGTGMHGGMMYIRGSIKDYQLGKEVEKFNLGSEDEKTLEEYLKDYCTCFSLDLGEIMDGRFIKLSPSSHRPYGKLYAY